LVSVGKDIHLHQQEKFMYLDGLTAHMLQHPKNINGQILILQRYELFRKILPLHPSFSKPKSFSASADKDTHLHLSACIECLDGQVIRSHLLPMKKAVLPMLEQQYVHHHKQFRLFLHFEEVRLISESVNRDTLRRR
jgi:hypothetical protein